MPKSSKRSRIEPKLLEGKMAGRTRLAPGEYLVPAFESQGGAGPGGEANVQTYFWGKVLRLVDDFLPSIEALLPDYRRAFGASSPPRGALGFLSDAEEHVQFVGSLERADESWQDLYPLARSVREWGERWHLSDPWCLETVLHTCHAWCYEGEYAELRRLRDEQSLVILSPRTYATRDEKAEPFLLGHSGWEFTMEWWAEYEARLRAKFEEEVRAYKTKWRDRAERREFRKAPVKRAPPSKDPHLHFEILVRWQCQEWTKPRIAKGYGYPPKKSGTDAVTSTLERTAESIGLTLRRGTPGRSRRID